ncbi:MAG TPA: EAL domain-containing protein [Acidobacteriaceae bacterium]|jgi:EAL domain-containing protein (putative c-di-GMP-specific phosphodiesterase class I)|nr:EAL domain-containing protein [Acidobacteriaceae bacterium]
MPGTTKKQFKPGEILVHEGERGDCAYIIEAGNVEILVQREGQTIQIGTRGPGSLVGEMAMVDDKPRTATVRAIDDCSVIEITRDDFARRIESADPVLSMVMRVITARYRDMFARAEAIRLEPANLAAESAERGGATHDVALSALRLHSELRLALERGELVLFYQPIIDIQKMKIAGFEALMRWMHPERGMISPGIFIPVAEDSGLILEISRFTLDASCDAAVRLQAAASKELIGEDPLFIGVNYSGRDFSEGEVIQHLAATLAAKRIDPRQIHLEITETLLMQEPEVARAELEKCRALGLNISIDDFGSGYSSLSYLHHFPIDTLKIDQSFIRSMSTHAGSLVLVKSILGLARNLGMKVIAEGVETAQDAATLRTLGCEYIQGYWFSKPLPFEAAIRFVQTWQPPPMENAAQ